MPIDLQGVSGTVPVNGDTGVPAELAQPRDVYLEHIDRTVGGTIAPDALQQLVDRHDAIGLQREHREHGTLLTSAQRQLAAGVPDLQWSEYSDSHVARPACRDRSPLHEVGPLGDRTYRAPGRNPLFGPSRPFPVVFTARPGGLRATRAPTAAVTWQEARPPRGAVAFRRAGGDRPPR